jgi:DNA repair protein SbcC/Rad50
MKILHLADVHACRDRWSEVAASLDVVEEYAARESVDLVAIAGDHADGPLQDSERDVLDRLCARYQRLGDIAPVVIIEGTPSHDVPGSLEVFQRLSCTFGITILRPGKAYGLRTADRAIVEIKPDKFASHSAWQLLLFGVPEPNKKWLLAEVGATGKEASDQAVRDAMRNLLLGLGGMRKQHSDLPCLLLYHGQVSGARTATGFGVESGTGLAVSRDDLAAVEADYYALGDIHEPQQIGDLPAYYPGSVYPLNWGETHKAGCNIVEFAPEVYFAIVSRLDFPHPQRVKITRNSRDNVHYEDLDLAGKVVWEEWEAPDKQWASLFDTSEELSGLMLAGALPGSRVTLNILPTETVRAGEITSKRTLREKVQVYAENSSLPATPSALEKADELEREGAAAGLSASGAIIRMTRLRLRGAKGIWKNQRIDEIDLNLEALGEGVLALVGANGKGKTTILENLHPWPKMLTRDGTLKSHFRLRDSFRDLYFTDDRTGWRYRALIQINAATASGGAEYFLSCDKGQGFEPLPGINGRLEPYEAAVAALFGSLEMYLRTAFQTQRPTKYAPDLSEATKGERKALFAELSGIDYLDAYRAEAKSRADSLDADLLRLEATIAAASDVEEVIRKASETIEFQRQAGIAAEGDEERAQASLARLAGEREVLAVAVASLDRATVRRQEIGREIENLLAEVAKAEKEIEGFRAAADGRGKAEEELARIRELEGEAAALRGEKAKIDEDHRKALIEFQEESEGLRLHSETLRRDLEAARKAHAQAEQDLAVAKAKLSAPIVDTCPTCGQALPADRLEALHHAHEEAEARVRELECKVAEAAAALEAYRKVYEDDAAEFSKRVRPEPAPFAGAFRLEELETDLAFADADALRATIRKADEAAVRIEEARTRAGNARHAAAVKRLDSQELETQIAEGLPLREALAAKEREIEGEREHLSVARSSAAAAKAFLEAATHNLEEARARLAARDEADKKRAALALERDDWRFLERACGPDGIQALELDALAPSIAAETNGLLAVQSERYTVRFDTTRIGGKGARAKQIEDFLIFVQDSETGEEQEIGTLSGGEAVWIRKALYDGFGIIRARNTGTQFRTVFLDEADGALDPEARMSYLRMLEAAHRQSGRYQTIIITHSRELQAMVGQVIDVTALAAREEKKEEAAA